MRLVGLACVVLALASACGDDSSTPPAADARPVDALPPPPDAAPPDAAPPDATVTMGIGVGALCPDGNECAPGLFCLDENIDAMLPADGYCTTTCTSDDDCGGDSFCSPTPIGDPGSPRLCFQRCATDAFGCAGAPRRVCSTSLWGFVDLGQSACIPGDPTAIDGSPCTGSLGTCNVNQVCFANEFEAPGGLCLTFGCTVGDDSTCAPGGDGTCIDAGGQTLCVDTCTASTQCRETEGYSCVMPFPGLMDDICFFLHAPPGSPCTMDTDCGATGSAWRCLTGAGFPGGYCSGALGTCDPLDGNTCPNGATCYDPQPGSAGEEYCAVECAGTPDCRMAEGYTCADIGGGRMGCVGP